MSFIVGVSASATCFLGVSAAPPPVHSFAASSCFSSSKASAAWMNHNGRVQAAFEERDSGLDEEADLNLFEDDVESEKEDAEILCRSRGCQEQRVGTHAQ